MGGPNYSPENPGRRAVDAIGLIAAIAGLVAAAYQSGMWWLLIAIPILIAAYAYLPTLRQWRLRVLNYPSLTGEKNQLGVRVREASDPAD